MEKFTVTYKDLKDESTGSTRVIIVNAENVEQAKEKVARKMRDVRVLGAHPTEMSDKRKGVPELKEAVDNKELLAHQQKVAVAKTTEEEQEPVFADASRNFEKTAKVKAEVVRMEKAPEHNEKPKRPKMVPAAKKMHLDESLFEESKVVDFDKVFPVVQEWLGDLLGQDDLESAAQSIAIALTRNASDIFSTVRRSLMPYIRNVVAFEEIEGIVPSIEDAINGITEARVGKTKEIKVLQGNYGYGWDDLIEYDISDFNGDILAMNKEITNDLRDYRENEKDAPHRVITRRVPVESLKEAKNPKFVGQFARKQTDDEINRFVDVFKKVLANNGFDTANMVVDRTGNDEEPGYYGVSAVVVKCPVSGLDSKRRNRQGDTVWGINNIIMRCYAEDGYSDYDNHLPQLQDKKGYGNDSFDAKQYNIYLSTDGKIKPYKKHYKYAYALEGNNHFHYDDTIEEFENDIDSYLKGLKRTIGLSEKLVESLKEDWSWDGDKVKIADEMERAFIDIDKSYPVRKSSDIITRDEFDEQFALACRKVLGIDNIWEYQETPIKVDGKEEDIFDIETDIRTILSMSGWETVFEGENEGGLQKLTEALNEGAGAGYTIKGSLSDIKINSINDIETFEGESAFGTKLTFARIDLDADAIFNGTAESYYYGGSIEDAKVKITSLEVNPNLIYNLHLEEFEYDKVTLEDLQDRLGYGSEIRFESDVIGGGWSHATFDGNVIASRVDDDYKPYIDGVAFNFVDKHTIEYIDRVVQEDDDEIDYDYADDMEDGYWEDKFNESLDSELADTFGYTYGISKSEARKRVAGLSKEEKQKKLDLLKNGIKRNAKADFYETQPSKLTEGAKSFLRTLGRDDIQYFTHKNRFNYDLKQIRIDNKNKTYEYGNFAWTNRLESTQNGKEFERLVDKLKEMGYTEIKKSLKERLAKRK